MLELGWRLAACVAEEEELNGGRDTRVVQAICVPLPRTGSAPTQGPTNRAQRDGGPNHGDPACVPDQFEPY